MHYCNAERKNALCKAGGNRTDEGGKEEHRNNAGGNKEGIGECERMPLQAASSRQSEKLTQEKTELEKKILETTKEQEQAMEQINNLQETIKEKDKEIEELSSKVSAQPVSTTSDEEDSKKQETKGPRNVTEKGMSLKEKAEALEKRRMELLGVR